MNGSIDPIGRALLKIPLRPNPGSVDETIDVGVGLLWGLELRANYHSNELTLEVP